MYNTSHVNTRRMAALIHRRVLSCWRAHTHIDPNGRTQNEITIDCVWRQCYLNTKNGTSGPSSSRFVHVHFMRYKLVAMSFNSDYQLHAKTSIESSMSYSLPVPHELNAVHEHAHTRTLDVCPSKFLFLLNSHPYSAHWALLTNHFAPIHTFPLSSAPIPARHATAGNDASLLNNVLLLRSCVRRTCTHNQKEKHITRIQGTDNIGIELVMIGSRQPKEW